MGWTNAGSLKGIKGDTGLPGAPGVGTPGEKGSTGAAGGQWHVGAGVPGTGVGADGDMFFDSTSSHVYHKVGGAWHDVGSVKGSAGAGISIKATVDAAALPTALGVPDAGAGYIISTAGTAHGITWLVGHLAVWDGAAWTDAGEIAGPEGPRGVPGPAGAAGPAPTFTVAAAPVAVGSPPTIVAGAGAGAFVLGLPQGAQGPKGDDGGIGATGASTTGAAGPRGSRWFTGVIDPVAGTPAAAVAGDMYLNTATGDAFTLS